MMRKLKDDFWSITGDFIYRHHNEPRVQLYVPKKKKISYSNEVHRRYQDNTYITGCIVGGKCWRLLERGWREIIVRCMDRLHKIHFYWTKGHLTDIHGPGGDSREKQATTRPDDVWPDMWNQMSDAAKKKATKMGYRETKARQCQTIERNILFWTKRRRIQAHNERRS